MEWLQILKRLEGGEDETTEFKRGLGDLSAIGKTICAFANAEGGVLVLGVENDGQITGVREDPDRFKERLTSFLQTGCSQPISARTGSHHEAGHWVHWIEVPRQRGFEPLSHHGRVWTRRARSSVEPSPTELQDLYNTFGYIVTEERGIQGAPASHIDLDAFLEYLDRMGFETQEEPQPNTLDDLRNRGVLVDLGGETRGTLYGVLAFGKHPQRYPQTQNFRIECVAYSGDDRASEVLQVAPGRGRLDEQVNRAVGWFQGLGHFESYQRLVREDRHLLPRAALREALVNAAIHRDYAINGVAVVAGSVLRPRGRHQSRHPPKSCDGRAGSRRSPPKDPQRFDGKLHDCHGFHGNARAGAGWS